MDIGLPVPLGTEGVFTGNEQEAQMASVDVTWKSFNLTWYLILTLDALEHHLHLGSCVLMPLPSLFMKNNSKNKRTSLQQVQICTATLIYPCINSLVWLFTNGRIDSFHKLCNENYFTLNKSKHY